MPRVKLNAAVAVRQREAVELRLAGHTYEAIAERLGYQGRSGSRKAVETALANAIKEPVEEVLQIELSRLDALQAGLWDNAVAGDVQYVDRVLKVMARRALLLGLDVNRLAVEVHDGDLADLDAALRELTSSTVPTNPRGEGAVVADRPT